MSRSVQSGEASSSQVPVSSDDFSLTVEELEQLNVLIQPENVVAYKQDTNPNGHYRVSIDTSENSEYIILRGHEADSDQTKDLLKFFGKIGRRPVEDQ